MKFKFKTQPYQQDAVSNIIKVFNGQPYVDLIRYTRDLGIKKQTETKAFGQTATIQSFDDYSPYNKDDSGFENAKIQLDSEDLLNNIQAIQQDNNYIVSESLVKGLGACSLDIEMETGTGKTYVYIKSIFDLNRKYGWSKFIVVVPSIAIREGVKKSFSMMEEHFMDEYHKKARYFVYNSKRLSELDSFASSSDIQVMIINVQAFNARGADARRIDMVLDEFQSRKPIDVVAKTRPILIIDEPQKMGGEVTQASLKKFNPLFNMNFSATHEKHHNLVYCLDALDAYNKNLVKKIQVKGFEIKNLRGTDGYLYLQDIIISKDKPPIAKLWFEIGYNKSINREPRNANVGYDLYHNSCELEQYKNGYVISEINPYSNTITFLNGIVIHIGEIKGDISEKDLRRIQIRETITSHFEKERILFDKGIKCLSLFFVDEVVKYRDYSQPDTKGEYATMFEQEYNAILNDFIRLDDAKYSNYLKSIKAEDTHKGYFSIDKKSGREIDSKVSKGEGGSDDISAYDLILKNKERLLSFEEPTRFIFSHSALREGWDNPNIFQICALKAGGDSATAKRQEVGRGLRIAVNMVGDRVDFSYCDNDKTKFHNINKLTVVATDSYKDFVKDIQSDIKKNLADRPTRATIEYFEGKFIIDDTGERIQVDSNTARRIVSYLDDNGYIDDDYRLTEKYFEDKKNATLKEMSEKLKPFEDGIYKLIQGIFDERVLDEMIDNGSKSKMQDNPLNENFNKREFQTLWNEINHKYAYTVSFNSDELIKKSIDELNKSLYVTELKYTVTIGEQRKTIEEEQIKTGDSFSNVKTKTMMLGSSKSDSTKYDLVGKIAKGTTLTRKTVVAILKGIRPDVFAMFKSNPEEFISKVSKIINEQKATMIVDHITYNVTDGKYDNDIFTANQVNIDLANTYKAKRAIQDYIITDGNAEKSIERKFAEDLDGANEVCVYAKLPRSFQIPTPVGNYAPDWAIAFNDNCGIKHIYFVAETKGSMESLELRGIEKAKTDCVRKLFNNSDFSNVRYEVVNTYSHLLDVMKCTD